ncbi:hypothetical protein BCR34DRAFT_587739 [Clohesyomyces aquaticus]|uniref:Uncharacterized protein n=1 Tax=Clohesyomyces aquaticus TaxID=1231657 RepID=A0A1Y1ZNC1_9PLEO|nr:hypothetical protein BCR34DRAFT_587739 [Clohesyomyces aquaticus]
MEAFSVLVDAMNKVVSSDLEIVVSMRKAGGQEEKGEDQYSTANFEVSVACLALLNVRCHLARRSSAVAALVLLRSAIITLTPASHSASPPTTSALPPSKAPKRMTSSQEYNDWASQLSTRLQDLLERFGEFEREIAGLQSEITKKDEELKRAKGFGLEKEQIKHLQGQLQREETLRTEETGRLEKKVKVLEKENAQLKKKLKDSEVVVKKFQEIADIVKSPLADATSGTRKRRRIEIPESENGSAESDVEASAGRTHASIGNQIVAKASDQNAPTGTTNTFSPENDDNDNAKSESSNLSDVPESDDEYWKPDFEEL